MTRTRAGLYVFLLAVGAYVNSLPNGFAYDDQGIITNNPVKRAGVEGYGIQIVEQVPLEIEPNENNLRYLRTKKEKLGHVLNLMG